MQIRKQDVLEAGMELEYARDLAAFISSSPSSYHAAHEVARRLEAAGYRRQDEGAPWDASPGGHYLVRDGAAMAWWVPKGADARSSFRIVGSHTDSPGFKLKPVPGSNHHGFAQVNVETYGACCATRGSIANWDWPGASSRSTAVSICCAPARSW
ncbi:hypothetical protein VR010_01375 [Actinomycetaceae bacterium L2_0104]